jgi:HK97 family phage major capsid protein
MARRYVSTVRNRIPSTPDELREFLGRAIMSGSDSAEAQELRNSFEQVINGYADAVNQADGSIETKVREQVTDVLTDWLREQRAGGVAPMSLDMTGSRRSARNALHNDRAPGAEVDRLFGDSGKHLAADFVQAIWHEAPESSTRSKLREVTNSFSSTVPSEGGFLLPETLRSDLLATSLESSIVRPRATVLPMSSLRLGVPSVDETTHQGSVLGGITAFWTEESASITPSQASFAKTVLDSKKLGIFADLPNELIADESGALQAFLDRTLPTAVSFYEDSAFLAGTGVGEPLSVYGGGGTISVTRAAGGNAVDLDDIIGMYVRMLPSSLGRAVWIASPAVLTSLLKLVMLIGTPTNQAVPPPLWFAGGPAVEGVPTSILGRPLIITEKVPDAGTAGDLSFVDLSYYLIGDRQAITARTSEHYRFQQDMTSLRLISRSDGRPWLGSPITPRNGGATLSAYVKLT